MGMAILFTAGFSEFSLFILTSKRRFERVKQLWNNCIAFPSKARWQWLKKQT